MLTCNVHRFGYVVLPFIPPCRCGGLVASRRLLSCRARCWPVAAPPRRSRQRKAAWPNRKPSRSTRTAVSAAASPRIGYRETRSSRQSLPSPAARRQPRPCPRSSFPSDSSSGSSAAPRPLGPGSEFQHSPGSGFCSRGRPPTWSSSRPRGRGRPNSPTVRPASSSTWSRGSGSSRRHRRAPQQDLTASSSGASSYPDWHGDSHDVCRRSCRSGRGCPRIASARLHVITEADKESPHRHDQAHHESKCGSFHGHSPSTSSRLPPASILRNEMTQPTVLNWVLAPHAPGITSPIDPQARPRADQYVGSPINPHPG
jgi:hypothetical protein